MPHSHFDTMDFVESVASVKIRWSCLRAKVKQYKHSKTCRKGCRKGISMLVIFLLRMSNLNSPAHRSLNAYTSPTVKI